MSAVATVRPIAPSQPPVAASPAVAQEEFRSIGEMLLDEKQPQRKFITVQSSINDEGNIVIVIPARIGTENLAVSASGKSYNASASIESMDFVVVVDTEAGEVEKVLTSRPCFLNFSFKR